MKALFQICQFLNVHKQLCVRGVQSVYKINFASCISKDSMKLVFIMKLSWCRPVCTEFVLKCVRLNFHLNCPHFCSVSEKWTT
jgi:hypothetical protein